MVLYFVIMLLVAIPLGLISIAIYKGKTNLIHDYHQTKVVDKAAYGKAFGKAMLLITTTLLLSGIVGLFGDSEKIGMISVSVLFIGLFVGIVCLTAVKVKYNKGIF